MAQFVLSLLALFPSICSSVRVDEEQESISEAEVDELMAAMPAAWKNFVTRDQSTFLGMTLGMKTLGEGVSGKVTSVSLPCAPGQHLALKSLMVKRSSVELIGNEVAFMRIGDPHLLNAYAYNIGTNGKYYILMPLAAGSLTDYNNALDNFHNPNFAERMLLARDMLAGLVFMHRKQLVHGDIKPGHVLYSCPPDRNGLNPKTFCRAALADFGLSCRLRPGEERVDQLRECSDSTIGGTAYYMAPEITAERTKGEENRNFKPLLKKADIYAAGKTLLAFFEYTEGHDLVTITTLKDLRKLFSSMSDDDEAKRPTAKNALADLQARLPDKIWRSLVDLDAPAMDLGDACKDTLEQLEKASALPSGEQL